MCVAVLEMSILMPVCGNLDQAYFCIQGDFIANGDGTSLQLGKSGI